MCGEGRDWVGLLGFPNIAACRHIAGDEEARLAIPKLLANPAVVETLQAGLARMNAEGRGSSMRVKRVILMAEPPSVDGHEITDKGYINQRAVLRHRAVELERLYQSNECSLSSDI